MSKRILLLAALACFLLPGCGGEDLADAVAGSEGPLVIYPDYKEVTIPPNIAPLNYRYAMKDVRKAQTTFTVDGRSVTIRGAEVTWPVRKWKTFLADAAGMQVIGIQSISEGGVYSVSNQIGNVRAKGMDWVEEAEADAGTVVQAAKLIVSASVTMVFDAE